MKTDEQGGGRSPASSIALAGLTVLCFLMAVFSLAGALFAVSKASTIVWQSVKHCQDGLVCMVSHHLSPNAVLLALGWTVLVFVISSIFPGVQQKTLLKSWLVLFVFGIAWVGIGFLVAILRLQMAWQEFSSAAVGAVLTLVAASMVVWFYRRFAKEAALVSVLVVCVGGLLFFLWLDSTHGRSVGLEVDTVAYVTLFTLLLTVSVPTASVGVSWTKKSQHLNLGASMFASSALAWSLFALTQVFFVVIWVWISR